LFAAGWSACFEGAMGLAARKMKIALPAETAIDAEVVVIGPCAGTVPKPHPFGVSGLFEREQPPHVVDIRHFCMERMERLEPANILRNQQVAGSIPAGGSILSL
jgi:hypothetical protein